MVKTPTKTLAVAIVALLGLAIFREFFWQNSMTPPSSIAPAAPVLADTSKTESVPDFWTYGPIGEGPKVDGYVLDVEAFLNSPLQDLVQETREGLKLPAYEEAVTAVGYSLRSVLATHPDLSEKLAGGDYLLLAYAADGFMGRSYLSTDLNEDSFFMTGVEQKGNWLPVSWDEEKTPAPAYTVIGDNTWSWTFHAKRLVVVDRQAYSAQTLPDRADQASQQGADVYLSARCVSCHSLNETVGGTMGRPVSAFTASPAMSSFESFQAMLQDQSNRPEGPARFLMPEYSPQGDGVSAQPLPDTDARSLYEYFKSMMNETPDP